MTTTHRTDQVLPDPDHPRLAKADHMFQGETLSLILLVLLFLLVVCVDAVLVFEIVVCWPFPRSLDKSPNYK